MTALYTRVKIASGSPLGGNESTLHFPITSLQTNAKDIVLSALQIYKPYSQELACSLYFNSTDHLLVELLAI